MCANGEKTPSRQGVQSQPKGPNCRFRRKVHVAASARGETATQKRQNNHRPRCSLFRVNHCSVATALVWLRLEPRVGHWSSPAHQGRVHSMLTMRSAGTQHAGQRNTGSSTSSGRRRSGAAHGPGQRAGPRAVRRRGVRSVFKRNSAYSQGIVAEQNFSKTYGFTFGIRK